MTQVEDSTFTGSTLTSELDSTYAAGSGATGTLVGYARVSTTDQVLDRQTDALRDAGCSKVFTDHGVSGAKATRPGLDEALAYLRPGDALVVVSLDRLGRSTRHLLELVEHLDGENVSLRILSLGLDTATPTGRLILTILAALAEMERELLRERTRDGLAAARARGRVGGRRRALSPEQRVLVREWASEGRSQSETARLLGVGRATVQRALAE